VSTLKLLKTVLYEKAARKKLVKNTPLVNSTTFYEQLLCRYSFTNKFLNQTAIREKLQKTLSYLEAVYKMLVK